MSFFFQHTFICERLGPEDLLLKLVNWLINRLIVSDLNLNHGSTCTWLAGGSFILPAIMIISVSTCHLSFSFSSLAVYVVLHLYWHFLQFPSAGCRQSEYTVCLENRYYSKCEQGHSYPLDCCTISCWQLTTHTKTHTLPPPPLPD